MPAATMLDLTKHGFAKGRMVLRLGERGMFTAHSHTIKLTLLAGLFFSSVRVMATVPTSETLQNFVQNHCGGCHSTDSGFGGLVLGDGQISAVEAHPEIWESVIRQLRTRQMPPQSEERPSEEEYRSVLRVLESRLDRAAQDSPVPGRTATFRRLTRFEYANAIRDVLSVPVDVTTLLPKDEISHGFDNVTVGELSPALLNRYISAAQQISQLAVGASAKSGIGRTIRVRPDITQNEHVPGLPLGTQGGILIPLTFPTDGRYRITVRLMRDRNEHVEGLRRPHKLDVLIDKKHVQRFPLKPPRSDADHVTADRHLTAEMDVTAGQHSVGVTFAHTPGSLIETKRQPYQASFNFHRHPRRAPAVYEVTIAAVSSSAASVETPSRRRIFVCQPDENQDVETCAVTILRRLMRRAYRRPVTNSDLAQPMKFFRNENLSNGFDAGIEAALSAILVNPNFLFRIERDQPTGEHNIYRVNDIELASRLSFFLWSSVPDEILLSVAEQNRLRDPTILAAQVTRMLADSRSDSLVTSFASQWLYLRNLEALTPDGRLFPDFDHNLRQAFRLETELFFQSVIREDRSVLDLLQSDYTYLNERLAKHYGIPHIYGSRFRRVQLEPDSHRGGLLRHGSILTVTSYATRTSPVIRGHWILQNFIGSPPPPPPDDVPALKDNTVDGSLSVRQRLMAHRANVACAGCHNLMDPIGFALENYDAIGRWREQENGTPIEAEGGLPGGMEFEGVTGLETGLLDRPELFVGTICEKLLTYALGRGVEYYDGPTIRRVVRQAAKEDYRFSAIIQDLVKSPAFQMRTVE